MLQVRQQHAGRAEYRGFPRHQQGIDAQFPGDGHRVYRSGAAGNDHGELARVQAALHRDHRHGIAHDRVRHAVNAIGGVREGQAQGVGYAVFYGIYGRVTIQFHGPAVEVIFIQVPQHQVGIRHGRFGAAMAVTCGAGVCPGTGRPHVQHAAVIDAGYGPAPGAHGVDVQHRHRHVKAAYFIFRCDHRPFILYQGDVETGAAHVHADDIFVVMGAAVMNPGPGPARGSGQQGIDGKPAGDFRGHAAAVGLHDIQHTGKPVFTQTRLQVLQVAGQWRPGVGIQRRGAVPLVHPYLRQYFAGQ